MAPFRGARLFGLLLASIVLVLLAVALTVSGPPTRPTDCHAPKGFKCD